MIQDLEGFRKSKAAHDSMKASVAKIVRMAETMTPAEIIKQTGLACSTVYRYLNAAGVDTKRVSTQRIAEAKKAREEMLRKERSRDRSGTSASPARFRRPPAEYSNRSPWGVATEYHN